MKFLIRIKPAPDELLPTYIYRLAHSNGVTHQRLFLLLRINHLPVEYHEAFLKRLLELFNLTDNCLDVALRDYHNLASWSVKHNRYLICPHCWQDEPIWRASWLDPIRLYCPIHHCHLVEHCPHCHNPISIHGDPYWQCRCGYDLRQVDNAPTKGEALNWFKNRYPYISSTLHETDVDHWFASTHFYQSIVLTINFYSGQGKPWLLENWHESIIDDIIQLHLTRACDFWEEKQLQHHQLLSDYEWSKFAPYTLRNMLISFYQLIDQCVDRCEFMRVQIVDLIKTHMDRQLPYVTRSEIAYTYQLAKLLRVKEADILRQIASNYVIDERRIYLVGIESWL